MIYFLLILLIFLLFLIYTPKVSEGFRNGPWYGGRARYAYGGRCPCGGNCYYGGNCPYGRPGYGYDYDTVRLEGPLYPDWANPYPQAWGMPSTSWLAPTFYAYPFRYWTPEYEVTLTP